jgi:nitrogen regulatory protein PII
MNQEISFQAILTVVARSRAEEVISVATEAGAKGGTIVPCSGIGHHDRHELFGTTLPTERELVIIVTPKHLTKQVAVSINERLRLEEPGQGLIMTLDLEFALGLLL